MELNQELGRVYSVSDTSKIRTYWFFICDIDSQFNNVPQHVVYVISREELFGKSAKLVCFVKYSRPKRCTRMEEITPSARVIGEAIGGKMQQSIFKV